MMPGTYIITSFIAYVIICLSHAHHIDAFSLAPCVMVSIAPMRTTRLYGKNKHSDRVKHQRRQKYFFTRRKEEDEAREPLEMQRLVNIQRDMMSCIFGRPLSQQLGDGGILPHLFRAEDKVGYVKSYFGIEDDANEEVVDTCKQVADNPYVACGNFEGNEPITQKPFYKEPTLEEEEEDFNRVADYKEGMPPMVPEMDEHERAGRFYSGLFTDIAFHHLPEKDMQELREMEMEAKQGRFKVNPKWKRRSGRHRDKRDGSGTLNTDDFPFLEGLNLSGSQLI